MIVSSWIGVGPEVGGETDDLEQVHRLGADLALGGEHLLSQGPVLLDVYLRSRGFELRNTRLVSAIMCVKKISIGDGPLSPFASRSGQASSSRVICRYSSGVGT